MVFPGVPVFLCNWHVQKAWSEQLLKKVPANRAVQDDMLSDLTAIQRTLGDKVGGCKAALDCKVATAVAAFCLKWAQYQEFVRYFQAEWVCKGKLGE